MVKLPYPKAGTPIPYTKLIIVNITSLEQIEIIPSHVSLANTWTIAGYIAQNSQRLMKNEQNFSIAKAS